MFKPASVSPNTLIPHHKGLDFFVFADLLKTAISSDVYNNMLVERDNYFTTSPRFGTTWLSQMRAMHSQLSDVVLAGSLDSVTLPPYLATGQGPQSDSRDAWGLDQVSRIAGWGFDVGGSGIKGDGPGVASPFRLGRATAQTRAYEAATRRVAKYRPVRTSPSSSPTLRKASPGAKKEAPPALALSPLATTGSAAIASTSLSCTPATSSSVPVSTSTESKPATTEPRAPTIGEVTVVEQCNPSKQLRHEAVKSEPWQAIKSEPSQKIKSEPSEGNPHHHSRGLKRERRESSYRVNIAHLSDLAGTE
jgi:hypothetical protein